MKTHNPGDNAAPEYDLRASRLSQLEAVGQSIAGIAPTATLAMIIPLLVRTSGQFAWLPFLIAMVGVLCLANQINLFVRTSPSSGSLYSYVYATFGPVPGLISGWSLFIAYIATAGAAVAGFAVSASTLLYASTSNAQWLVAVIALLSAVAAAFLAYCDVHLSVRVMLVVEFCSVGLLFFLFCLPGAGSIWHASLSPIHLSGSALQKVGGGLVLAVLSFVGFESAASLGPEVATPSKAIPRALRIAVVMSGLLFMFAACAEYQGFRNTDALEGSVAPLCMLAAARGVPKLSGFLLAGSAASFLACILACFTAASRLLMQMSRDGHVPAPLGRVHAWHRTPHVALVATVPCVILPMLLLLGFHAKLLDIYEWLGIFATVGFVIAYLLIVVAAMFTAMRSEAHQFRPIRWRYSAEGLWLSPFWGLYLRLRDGWLPLSLQLSAPFSCRV